MDRNAPLGVFDSGLGGLTVVRALRKACPNEDIIYLGDTARVPYGTRSAETVVRYARRAAHELTVRGVKALVLACNTVSAVALEILRAELDMPVLGVVEPGASAAVEAALVLSAQGQGVLPRIGVMGTAGTIRSGAYPRAVAALSTRLEVLCEPAPLLVPLVEEGWLEGQVPELAVERYVTPLIRGGAGVLVLGCTHYPLLEPVFRQVSERLSSHPPAIVDSVAATAAVVRSWIEEGKILPATDRTGALTVLVTDQPSGFQRVADLFLGEHSPRVEQIDLGTEGSPTVRRPTPRG